jgi:hypothetical protein
MDAQHDSNSYYCQCHQCWENDVADQASRVRKQEDAVIKQAAEIIKRRKEQ